MLSQNQEQLPVSQFETVNRQQQFEDWHTYGFYNQDGTPVVPTEQLAAAIIADDKARNRPRNERNERAFQAYLAGRMVLAHTTEEKQHFANADTDPGVAYELGRRDMIQKILDEREACARVADEVCHTLGAHDDKAWLAAEEVAQLIRSRTHPSIKVVRTDEKLLP